MTMTEPNTSFLNAVLYSNLLNTYLREIRLLDPQGTWDPTLTVEDSATTAPQMSITLPTSGGCLIGTLEFHSASGHHRFGPTLWHRTGAGEMTEICSPQHLATVLLKEFLDPASEPFAALLTAIENSLAKTATYLDAALRPEQAPPAGAAARFLAAEQRLIVGHPFHPTPKSSEGFSDDDLALYAPELGAAFVLQYLAVDPDFVIDDLPTDDHVIPADVRDAAIARLGAERRQWKLLPCHPWQAAYLQRQPAVQALIERDRLAVLGALGETVYPTSSVRTVIVPQHQAFFKLPLNVRITNFTRTNPIEHARRSMDASRAVAIASAVLPNAGFTILKEIGYRTLRPVGPVDEALSASSTVLFRELPFALDEHAPLVLAGLLETSPRSGTAPLLDYLRQAAQPHRLDAATVHAWVRRYLDLGLLPILVLFLKRGISLEAHVQNTLLAFKDGWPSMVYVRDLEGVSISRELATSEGWYNQSLSPDSPVFYDEVDAWHRLKYYVIVNQLSHVLATIAHGAEIPEADLWSTTRQWLLEQPALMDDARSRHYVHALLAASMLPAKANLVSRFQNCAETPIYVAIANPLNMK